MKRAAIKPGTKRIARKTPLQAGTKILPRRGFDAAPSRTGTMKRRTAKPSDAKNRSAAWLAAVRAIPHCVLCQRQRSVEAAHENQGKGIGWKVPDCLTAAICPVCHFDIDNGSEKTLEVRRQLMSKAIRATIVYLFQHDMIGVVRA